MIRHILALTSLVFATATSAQNLTQQNVEKTLELIELAVAAHGGDKLNELSTVTVQFKDTNIAAGQSLRPDPPWDRNTADGMVVMDAQSERFYSRNWGTGGGFEFDNVAIFNGDDSYQVNHRAGTAQPIAELDYAARTGPFVRVTPPMLLRQLQARSQNAHYLGDATAEGVDYDVIAFSMTTGPAISLYFDKKNHQLLRSERFLPGFGLVEYRFNDYKSIDGVPFNMSFVLYVAGDITLERTNTRIELGDAMEDRMTVDKGLRVTEALEPDPLTRQELADDVYLIGGQGTYAMFVEMDDHVVAIGGTGGIPERIESLREVLPEKPIRYGVLTHHHSDHVLGVAAYEAEGATVVASEAHEGAARAAAEDGEALKFDGVGEKKRLGKGKKRIELIDIGPTAHAEHFVVAWMPRQKILFEADHFARPRSGPVPPAVTGARNFAAALKRLGIEPKYIVSAHSPRPATMDDLQEALDQEPVKISAR
ncbi:MAG: MBL fold metallo-hydrolase [Granulosicoccus sp.]